MIGNFLDSDSVKNIPDRENAMFKGTDMKMYAEQKIGQSMRRYVEH